MADWERSLETLPDWGSTVNGVLYRRPTWAPLTSAKGCSSWLTPDRNPERPNLRSNKKSDKSLLAQAQSLWPTPKAESKNGRRGNDPRHGRVLDEEASLWPTPKASAANYGQPREDDRGDLQAAAVGPWATPSARDWKSGAASAETLAKNSRPLNEQAVSLPAPETPPAGENSSPAVPTSRRQLNVLFVEALFGLPIGWSACEPSGIPLSLCKLPQPSPNSCEGSSADDHI
jgi:hypothetical protein